MFAPLFRFEVSDHYMKKTITAYPGNVFSACSAPYLKTCYKTQKKALLAHLSREGSCDYCSTISLILDTKQKWVKGIQIYSNELSRLL